MESPCFPSCADTWALQLPQATSPLLSLSHRLRLTSTEICLDTKKKEAGAREPDAGFFCTSVFLTPQPVAAYNKTEIRKSNQNTHPKAKNPWLKEGAAGPPGKGWQRGSKGGKRLPWLGRNTTQRKNEPTKKTHPRLPLRSGERQKSPDCPDLSPVSTCTIKLYRPRGRAACPHPLPGQRRGKGAAPALGTEPGAGHKPPKRGTGSSSTNEMEEGARERMGLAPGWGRALAAGASSKAKGRGCPLACGRGGTGTPGPGWPRGTLERGGGRPHPTARSSPSQ